MKNIGGEPQKLIAEKVLEIGKFQFFSNVIVGEFNDGVHVTHEKLALPLQMAREVYGDSVPVVYLSHRVHSYSSNPIGHKKLIAQFPNFVGFGVVSNNRYRRGLIRLEKHFIKGPVQVFYELPEAFDWAERLLGDRLMVPSEPER